VESAVLLQLLPQHLQQLMQAGVEQELLLYLLPDAVEQLIGMLLLLEARPWPQDLLIQLLPFPQLLPIMRLVPFPDVKEPAHP
jgi:hypothetical protein